MTSDAVGNVSSARIATSSRLAEAARVDADDPLETADRLVHVGAQGRDRAGAGGVGARTARTHSPGGPPKAQTRSRADGSGFA